MIQVKWKYAKFKKLGKLSYYSKVFVFPTSKGTNEL